MFMISATLIRGRKYFVFMYLHTSINSFQNDKSEWHSASLVSVMSEVQTEVRRNSGG